METYYHLTTKENAHKILVEGLKPINGERRKMVNDSREGIFMCKKEDIASWQIILDLPVILEINNIETNKEQEWNYTLYSEILYDKPIPAEDIKESNIKITKSKRRKKMRELCEDYIRSFNHFCVLCARYYNNLGDESYYRQVKEYAESLLVVIPKLDYSVLTKEEIKEFLKNEGDSGEYTICDDYAPGYESTKHRLYVQLQYYPKDGLYPYRKQIYEYIKTTFKGCLRISTGGWCG